MEDEIILGERTEYVRVEGGKSPHFRNLTLSISTMPTLLSKDTNNRQHLTGGGGARIAHRGRRIAS